MLKKVNRSDLGPIDHSFELFGPVVRLTNTDKHTKTCINHHVCDKEKGIEKSAILVIMWSAASPQPMHPYMPMIRGKLNYNLVFVVL